MATTPLRQKRRLARLQPPLSCPKLSLRLSDVEWKWVLWACGMWSKDGFCGVSCPGDVTRRTQGNMTAIFSLLRDNICLLTHFSLPDALTSTFVGWYWMTMLKPADNQISVFPFIHSPLETVKKPSNESYTLFLGPVAYMSRVIRCHYMEIVQGDGNLACKPDCEGVLPFVFT